MIPYRRALFLDPKRRNAFDGWAMIDGQRAAERRWPREFARLIARPGMLESEREWMDALCRRAYYTGSCAVAVDELAGIATESRPLPYLDELLRRGRDPGPQGPITTLVATQRPRRIPLAVLSEAEHLFVFDLNVPDDRAFMRELVGAYEPPRLRHGFWYWRPDLDAAVECQPIAL